MHLADRDYVSIQFSVSIDIGLFLESRLCLDDMFIVFAIYYLNVTVFYPVKYYTRLLLTSHKTIIGVKHIELFVFVVNFRQMEFLEK